MAAGSTYVVLCYAAQDLPEAYRPMVFSKWLRSLRYGNDYFKLVQQDAYFSGYHRVIERILASNSCEIRLAVLGADHDVVLGFSVSRGDALDYLHVHKDYRRRGIGASLLPPLVNSVTHVTKNGISFWTAKLPKAVFNPFQ